MTLATRSYRNEKGLSIQGGEYVCSPGRFEQAVCIDCHDLRDSFGPIVVSVLLKPYLTALGRRVLPLGYQRASKPNARERDPVKHSAFRSVFCPSPVNFQRFRYVLVLFALSIYIHTPSVRDAVHPHPASPTKHPLWTTMNPSTTQHPNTTSTVSGKYQNAKPPTPSLSLYLLPHHLTSSATPGQTMDRPYDGGIPGVCTCTFSFTRPYTPPRKEGRLRSGLGWAGLSGQPRVNKNL